MNKVILLFIAVVVLFGCKKPDGTLAGVVTYEQNKSIGYRPDVGSKIYVTNINCDSLRKAIDAILINDYIHNLEGRIDELKNIESLDIGMDIESLIDEQNLRINEQKKELQLYSKNEKDFENKIKRSAVLLYEAITNHLVGSTSVDGTGKYSLNIEPGTYNVIAISKANTRLNVLEINGEINIKSETIKSNEITNLDFEF
jgi:hypothetical protein